MGADSIAAHENPVWRQKADSLIHVDLEPWGLPGRLERLSVRRADANLFEVCCIPFFSYGIRLGDLVQATGHDQNKLFFERVVVPSGRLNVRLVVNKPEKEGSIAPRLCAALEDARCPYEEFKRGYVAADVPSAAGERVLLTDLRGLLESGDVTIERV